MGLFASCRRRLQKFWKCGRKKNLEGEESPLDKQIRKAFYAIADDPAYLRQQIFEDVFGPELGRPFWRMLQGDQCRMSMKQFIEHAHFLVEMERDNYARIMSSPTDIFKAFFATKGICVEKSAKDIEFVCKLITNIESMMLPKDQGNESEIFIRWKDDNCPRIFQSIHGKVLNVFAGMPELNITNVESELLSPAQILFLQYNLPLLYFETGSSSNEPDNEREKAQKVDDQGWKKIYESKRDGLKPEIFVEKITGWEGSSVAIFEMKDDHTFALAVDEQWKCRREPFGGPYTFLIKFHPDFKRIEADPPAFHCNLADPALINGIYFNGGLDFSVRTDFSNVTAVEVWRCSRRQLVQFKQQQQDGVGENVLKRVEETREGDKKKRTKTSAKARAAASDEWERNPDKAILEMAGFAFSDRKQQRGNKREGNR